MLKKHLLLVLLMVMATVSVSAGTWKKHNYYLTSKIQNVYDVGDKVYYLNSGSLYEFDKATTKTVALTNQNKLSDNQISQMYYDWESKLLFIAYLNCNIDIIDSEGVVYNVSRLKDVVVDVNNYTLNKGVLEDYTGKTINDITFANGMAYVAVDYGYVAIDESTKMIKKNVTLVTAANVNSVAIFGNKMAFMTNGLLYYGPKDAENPVQTYTRRSGSYAGAKFYPINDNAVFMLSKNGLYYCDFTGQTVALTKVADGAATSVQKTPNGYIANFAGQKYYYTIDATGLNATKVTVTNESFATIDPNGNGSVTWINDGAGLHQNGSTVNYGVSAISTDEPYWLKYNAALDRLYVCTTALNGLTRTRPNNMAPNVINYYDGTNWHAATPYTSTGSGYNFVFNPSDPTTYFRASWSSGLHRVTNDTEVFRYHSGNSMMGSYKAHPAFDKSGNLWIVSSYGASSNPVAVLPSNKVAASTVGKANWFVPSGLLSLNTGSMQRSRFIISKKNNVKIYADCDYKHNIYCWDNFNDDYSVDNYRLSEISHFVDQNNRQIRWTYLWHMEEDNDGLIWVGAANGLFAFDPDQAFEEYPKAYRPYVTNSSEGSGTLCEGYTIYDIGVDRDNNKWIAGVNGLYFVSPDGSEVYNHFTTSNSDIPSDLVYSVECDTVNNRVYIFTDNGFAEYIPDGDASQLNFDNVYAFPNPVEPDFTGLVKIAGLMENSYVTITDREGSIVAQMGPVMGSALWDASYSNGERVATGVYNVYAAQGAYPAITGEPKTTIMVIR